MSLNSMPYIAAASGHMRPREFEFVEPGLGLEGINVLNADNLCSNDQHSAGIGDILLSSLVSRWLRSDISIE